MDTTMTIKQAIGLLVLMLSLGGVLTIIPEHPSEITNTITVHEIDAKHVNDSD